MNKNLLKPSVILGVHQLQKEIESFQIEYNCLVAEGTWYFDHFYEKNNPPEIYKQIISQARKIVWVWDPYLHEGDEEIFSSVGEEVNLRFLTCKGLTKNIVPSKLQGFIDKIKQLQQTEKFGLEIYIYNTMLDTEKRAFHDRYLFVDDDVYSVGASVEYHRKRMNSTSIHLIQNKKARDLIKKRFLNMWCHSNIHQALTVAGGMLR